MTFPMRPVTRVDRRYLPPPGGAVVGVNYVQAMAAQAARGGGPVGTRAFYSAVQGHGRTTRVIPLVATPAVGVERAARGTWLPGATRIGHGMAGLGEQITLESWGKKRNTKDMGGPVAKMTVSEQLSQSPCSEGASFGYQGSQLWVDKGCRAVFDVALVSGVGEEGQRLKAAVDVLNQFERQLRSGSVPPDAALPAGTDGFGTPTNPANQSLYGDYVVLRDTLIPSARDVGRMYWSLRNQASSGSSGGAVSDPSTGAIVPTGSSSGGGSFQTNIPNDLYGGASDPTTGLPSTPTVPTTTVVGSPTAAAAARRRVPTSAYVVGGVLVVGGVALLLRHLRKRR